MPFSPLFTSLSTISDASHQAYSSLDDIFSSWNLVNCHNPMLSDSPSSAPEFTAEAIQKASPSASVVSSASAGSSPVAKGTSVPRIPRPLNSFMTYRKVKQHEVIKKYPEADNRDISRIVASWWNQESEDEKEKWRKMAEEGKRQHAVMFPGYKYCPQKKSAQKKPRSRHIDTLSYKASERVGNSVKKRLESKSVKTNIITQKQLWDMFSADNEQQPPFQHSRDRVFSASSYSARKLLGNKDEVQWANSADFPRSNSPDACPPAPQPQPQTLLTDTLEHSTSVDSTTLYDSRTSGSSARNSPDSSLSYTNSQSLLEDELVQLLFGALTPEEPNAQNTLSSVDAFTNPFLIEANPLLWNLNEYPVDNFTPFLKNTDFCLLPSYDIHEMSTVLNR